MQIEIDSNEIEYRTLKNKSEKRSFSFVIGLKDNYAIPINAPNQYLSFTVFPAKPPTPPSAAQEATLAPVESSPFLHSIKRLALNRNYFLLLLSYGMNVGVFYAISTLLNQVSKFTINPLLWCFFFVCRWWHCRRNEIDNHKWPHRTRK